MKTYIGLPYASKGRNWDGVDCWGLVVLYYKNELNIQLPSYASDYNSSVDRKSVSEAVTENLPNWEKVDEARHGDLLIFNIFGLPLHAAVYLGSGDFLHAFMNTNSCIERLNSITWERRLHGIYRWKTNN